MMNRFSKVFALALAVLASPSHAALLASWDAAVSATGAITDPVDVTVTGGGGGGTALLDTDGTFVLFGLDNIALNLNAGFFGSAVLDLSAEGIVIGTYNSGTQQLAGNIATVFLTENAPCAPGGLAGGVICDEVDNLIDFDNPLVLTPADGLADPITFDLVNDFSFILGDLGGAATLELSLSNVELVAPVPLPAAAWLFGSALLGLAATARRRTSQA